MSEPWNWTSIGPDCYNIDLADLNISVEEYNGPDVWAWLIYAERVWKEGTAPTLAAVKTAALDAAAAIFAQRRDAALAGLAAVVAAREEA